jgi:two-component system response regulator PilR (NtrC family)
VDERIRIIAIDDEEPMLRILRKTLEPEGFRVETYQRPDEALSDIRKGGADLVITDLMMPGLDGYRVLEETLAADPGIIVIVITAFSSIESAVKAMKAGAYDFIPKPFDPEHLLIVVKKAIQKRALERENLNLRQQLDSRDYLSEIVGVSGPIRELKALIEKVKDTDANLLIIGESGVGKELVARAVHYGSRRKAASFVPINCGALPDNLLESELFGYERGAFTGALSRKKGLLEMAAGGTVFLDEVESISPMMQVKILRFLQDRRSGSVERT